MANNTTEMLKDLVQKHGAAAAPAAPAPEATTDVMETLEATTAANSAVATAEETRRAEEREQNNIRRSSLLAKINEQAKNIKQARSLLLDAVSAKAAICGYIVKNGPRLDFYAAPSTSKVPGAPTMYDIRLRQSAPSSPEGVIVKYPAALLDLLEQPDVTMEAVETAKAANPTYMIKIEEYAKIVSVLLSKCAGFLPEDKEIFVPYITKGKKFTSLTDVATLVKKENIPAKGGLYVDIVTRKTKKDEIVTTTQKMVVKHSYRNRIPAPGNFIARRVPATIALKQVYGAAEAKEMIATYLSRFTNPNRKGEVVAENLKSESMDLAMVNNHEIVASNYFPTEASKNWYTTHPELVPTSWYFRDADGKPAKLAFDELALAKREQRTGKNGNVSYSLVYKALSDPMADASEYRLDAAGEHKKVCDACEGKLTFEDIAGFKTTRMPRKSKGKTAAVSLQGKLLAGLDEDALKELLDSFKYTTQA